ncbi:MAG: hypothetical protein HY926_14815 [Elusimicrobia bacterium]|nr:hypothetical protein [Elusimicrobiota bacterium]
MTRLILLGLLAGGTAVSALAADAPASSYEAGASLRYVDLDTRGSRGQVSEYDGKLYKFMHGDIWVSNQGEKGLFDISLFDIGSTEENGTLHADYKDTLRFSAKTDTIHHRRDFTRTGFLINGIWTPATHFTTMDFAQPGEFLFRRTESTFNLDIFAAQNPAQFFSAEYRIVDKRGQAIARAPNALSSRSIAAPANVDNITQDVTLAAGTNIKQAGALALDIEHLEFKDYSYNMTNANASNRIVKPVYSAQRMTGGGVKFRYDPSKTLAVTGAVTGNSWDNLKNGYNKKAVVGTVNATYRPSSRLSVTGKLYARAYQIDEVQGYVTQIINHAAQGNQMDKSTVRAEIFANYKAAEKVRVKGGYRVEVNNRRDAGNFNEPTATAFYLTPNGEIAVPPSAMTLVTAHNDVKHVLTATAEVGLPLDIEAEASYRRLQANTGAYAINPDRQDTADLTVTVPLPKDVQVTLMTDYTDQASHHFGLYNNREWRNTYRAGLDWAMNRRVSFGADASYETIRHRNNGLFGDGAAAAGGTSPAGSAAWWLEEISHSQKNTVAAARGRFELPKGFTVLGNGSYTWMTVHAPIQWPLNAVAGYPASSHVGDWTPRDIRIARGGAAIEFTPPKYKSLTARASYRIDDWVDKFDANNSGRASVGEVGVSAKF